MKKTFNAVISMYYFLFEKKVPYKMEKNARKKGDIKNDVLYIFNNKSIFK